jgi:EAL domain-containing protein (putative c-di-GMP-specific phosphodiesterase class I)
LKTGIINGAEALLRWHHPQRGIVVPDEFIPIAEETGLIQEIGHRVFEHAVLQLIEWQKVFGEDFSISINVSPVQFQDTNHRIRGWPDLIGKNSLKDKSIGIEITESLLKENRQHISETLSSLREHHFYVALDDFGTGYSSLAYLKIFQIDRLEIDRSFVRNLSPGSDDLALCEAIIVMAHKLNLEVVAEGVETEVQRQLLAQAGCDFAQGYLFSRPVSSSEFLDCLTS